MVYPANRVTTIAYDATMITTFLYSCINPFIYAIKFDPVRHIIRDLIRCKKTAVQHNDGSATSV